MSVHRIEHGQYQAAVAPEEAAISPGTLVITCVDCGRARCWFMTEGEVDADEPTHG